VGTMNSVVTLFVILAVQVVYMYLMFNKQHVKKFTSKEKQDILGMVAEELLVVLMKNATEPTTASSGVLSPNEKSQPSAFVSLAEVISKKLSHEMTRNPLYYVEKFRDSGQTPFTMTTVEKGRSSAL
jgi:hypothetical protein